MRINKIYNRVIIFCVGVRVCSPAFRFSRTLRTACIRAGTHLPTPTTSRTGSPRIRTVFQSSCSKNKLKLTKQRYSNDALVWCSRTTVKNLPRLLINFIVETVTRVFRPPGLGTQRAEDCRMRTEFPVVQSLSALSSALRRAPNPVLARGVLFPSPHRLALASATLRWEEPN